jgi:hypothetical protein
MDHREVASLTEDILPKEVRELAFFERNVDEMDAVEAHGACLGATERGSIEPAFLEDCTRV